MQMTVAKCQPLQQGICLQPRCHFRHKALNLAYHRSRCAIQKCCMYYRGYDSQRISIRLARRSRKHDAISWDFCHERDAVSRILVNNWVFVPNISSSLRLSYNFNLSPYNRKDWRPNSSGLFSWFCEDTGGFSGILKQPLQVDDFAQELASLVGPSIAEQALQPLAQLMETAFLGRLGPVELGAVAVSLSVFNLITKLFNIPLLNVTASFVAEDASNQSTTAAFIDVLSSSNDDVSNDKNNYELWEQKAKGTFREHLPSISTALILATGLGILEAVILAFGAGPLLNAMGISAESPMRLPSERYLSLRALSAPAVVLTLAAQGVFRGLKDTKTSMFASGAGNILNVFLFWVCIFGLQLGLTGAAIATVVSQYFIAFLLLWNLSNKMRLLPRKLEDLNFSRYLKSGGFLLGRTVAVTVTTTLATAMAARQGPIFMAGHQICVQVWLAASLLTDSLASAGQSLIAAAYAKREYSHAKRIATSIIQIGLLSGLALVLVLYASLGSIAKLFTNDVAVLEVIGHGILFVAGSQPINALAFIFDGLHYGVSDFAYSAYSMMTVAAISSIILVFATSVLGGTGVWTGLVIFMGLRMAAGFWRLADKGGPWWFLSQDRIESTID